MTSSVDKSTCKYLNFQPDRDCGDSGTKVPVYGYLVFEDGCPVEQHTFPLEWKNFIIGREKAAHLRVLTAITSRVHCIISQDNDEVITLSNKSSLNHTCVNDNLVEDVTKLLHGDIIKVGQHVFKFKAVENNPVQEDTVACDSTVEENVCDVPEIKQEEDIQGNRVESEKVEQQEEDEEEQEGIDEEIETKNEIKPVKRNGRKISNRNTGVKKNGKKVKQTIEKPVEEHEEEQADERIEEQIEEKSDVQVEKSKEMGPEENESEPEEKKEDSSGHGSDIAPPPSVSEDKSENDEEMSIHASVSEEKDEDEDGSMSVSASEEKMNEEVSSPPLRSRSRNNLKVTFKPPKEPKKVQPVTTDAGIRRSNRRRPHAAEDAVAEEAPEPEPEPEEPKKAKTTKKATAGTRRKKAAVEEEEEPVRENEIQEENKKPKRGRKPKVQVEEVSDDSTAAKPPTRRLRSRK